MIRSLVTLAAMALLPFTAQAAGPLDAAPSKVPAAFDRVYAPAGFDSNDIVQVVGEGMFENSCYRATETTVRVDEAGKKIFLGPAAYKYNGLCLQVVLPFERTVEIGLVPAGNYEIVQEVSNKVIGHITIKGATRADADDYNYAPISQAMFRETTAGAGEVALQGNFMSNCMSIDNVKVDIQPEAIVIQPIVKMEQRNDCLRGSYPFTKVVKIDKIPAGRFLLHVRSMNAKAVNNLVDVK